MVNYYRALLRNRAQLSVDNLPIIEVPTLMIWGEEDVALTKATTYGTEEYVSDFRIRYLPGVSHWVQQEAPEAVNAMITAFLSGQTIPEMRWAMVLESPSSS